MARSQNEGEGSRSAARDYNERTKKFIASGRVKPAARKAAKDLDTPEGAEEMRAAERIGKSRTKSAGTRKARSR